MAALTVKAGEAQPFSREDVADYFKTHNLPKNLSSMSEFQVDALEFLTNKAVSDRLRGASPGLGDEERVGFVTLRGRVRLHRPAAWETGEVHTGLCGI